MTRADVVNTAAGNAALRFGIKGAAAHRNNAANAPPSSGGTTSTARFTAPGPPSRGSAGVTTAAKGRSAKRDRYMSTPTGGLRRRCAMSFQPWPSTQSRTRTTRMKSSGPTLSLPAPPS